MEQGNLLDRRISEEKKRLRREALAGRKAVTKAHREAAEQQLLSSLRCHDWYQRAEAVLAYKSYGSELSVDALIQEAYLAGKQVFLPRVEGQDLAFYRVCPGQPLEAGYKGILEPFPDDGKRFADTDYPPEKVLMLMPGAAFDRKGNRLGYGGGYYDRYLQNKGEMPTIAVGFLCQMIQEEIPAEKTDVMPKKILCF